jgi:hypothetical protein
LKFNFVLRTEMDRIRSTARLRNEGEETEATKTAPISKVMRCSGLVVQEGEGSIPEKMTLLPKVNIILPKLLVMTMRMMAS